MSKSAPLTPMEDAQIEHGWADHSDRFPMDQLIRKCEYEVIGRPNKGPVLWRPKGFKRMTFTQAQVIAMEGLNT